MPPLPAAETPTLILLRGRLFDPERLEARPLGQLWIGGERVLREVAPEDAATTPLPAGVATFDCDGCTVVPGLFDLHVHLMVSGAGQASALQLPPDENLATAAAFGVLNEVDVHNDPRAIFALRQLSAGAPGMARAWGAGAAFTVPSGHGTQFGIDANTIAQPGDVAKRFEALLPWKPDLVKAIVEHGAWGTLPPMPTLDETALRAIAERTHAAKLPLVTHVWKLDEAKMAVRAGADALVHGVFVGEVDDELVAAMKERDVAYVPTLSVVVGPMRVAQGRPPYTSERLDGLLHPDLAAALGEASGAWAASWDADPKLFLRNLRRLHDAGIRVATGTDAGNPLTPHGPALLEELSLFVEAGLSPAQALAAATIEAARVLRHDGDAGSLAPGKLADLVIVRGDPTAGIDTMWRIEGVLKGDVAVDRAALRTANAARARPAVVAKLGVDVAATLDDFDDVDLACPWGGEWGATHDGLGGGKSTAKLEAIEGDGGGRLLATGALAAGFPQGPFAGVSVRFDPEEKRLVDLAGATTLLIRARGSPRRWSLVVDRAAVKDWNLFASVFDVDDELRTIRVPLASFRQLGRGAAVKTAWNDVKGLTITARNDLGGKPALGDFELEIDSIAFE